MKIAAIGEAMIELSVLGANAQLGVAGDTLNTAIYLKRTAPQLDVDFITCLGTDRFSERIKDFITDQSLGIGAIETITDRLPGLYAITTDESGERSFSYWREQSAARLLFQSDKDISFQCLENYDAIYLSGITLAILPPTVGLALLDYLKKSDHTLAFDSNYRPSLWTDKDTARHLIREFWKLADLALPSIDDEMLLMEESADAVTTRFIQSGIQGALKRGSKGPISLGESLEQLYSPAPRIVDTTAAGDSFNGAYLGSIFTSGSQAEALAEGHACARHVVQYHGAIAPIKEGRLDGSNC